MSEFFKKVAQRRVVGGICNELFIAFLFTCTDTFAVVGYVSFSYDTLRHRDRRTDDSTMPIADHIACIRTFDRLKWANFW